MPTLIPLANRNRSWLLKWTFYPIVAYFASFVVGLLVFMPLVFVVSLVVIQWKRIERLTGNKKAVYWLFSVVVCALLAWQRPTSNSYWLGVDSVVWDALLYFGTQALGELLLSQLTVRWRWGRFALANGLAAGCWLFGYFTINWLIANQLDSSWSTTVWMWIGIPALGTLGNLITGLGLLASSDSEPQPIEKIDQVRPYTRGLTHPNKLD